MTLYQSIVKIYNDQDIKLLSKNLIDVALKTVQSVRKSKKHDLVYEMVIPSSKKSLLFIVFSNFHLVISTS